MNKTYAVYHAAPIIDAQGRMTGIHGAFGWEPSIFPDEFIHVADVECASIDQVFALTQNLAHSWFHNLGVTRRTDETPRSTSVGDVIRHNHFVWVIAPMGVQIIPMAGTDRVIIPAQYRRV